jgi:hypothetical protein
MNYDYIEGKWITKDGTTIDIKNMSTTHIIRTIKYLETHPDFYCEGYYDIFFNNGNNYFEPNYELAEKKIEEFDKELEARAKEFIDFL